MIHKLRGHLTNRRVIRERDGDGSLMAAGFEWGEPVPAVNPIFGSLGAIAAYFWLRSLGDAEPSRDVQFFLFMSACACLFVCGKFGVIFRGVSFDRNGRMRPQGGWFNRLSMLAGLQEHADIASIELKRIDQAWGVAIYTNWGGTTILSTGLHEGEARLAAVQLTIALREMREQLTSIENFQRQGYAQRAIA